LHKWEIVSQGDQGENATTYRMRVRGGWLYRYQPNITARHRAWRSSLIQRSPKMNAQGCSTLSSWTG
jgi:hypothetical protein